MRWRKKFPHDGDKRIQKKFLFLPKKINWEYRWLERAVWKEEYSSGHNGCYWIATEWID